MVDPFQHISLRKDRLSDQVKRLVKNAILEGHFNFGDRLPSEKEIAETFQISKVTAREALQGLENEGIIEKRRGVQGGSFVARPGSEKFRQTVMNYYCFGELTPEELVEFRKILEPDLAALAAKKRTEEDLAAMRANLVELGAVIKRGKFSIAKAIKFHQLIADACHNRLISAFMDALAEVFIEILSKIPITVDGAKEDLEYNKKLYKHISLQQVEETRRLMVKHFDNLAKIIGRQSKKM